MWYYTNLGFKTSDTQRRFGLPVGHRSEECRGEIYERIRGERLRVRQSSKPAAFTRRGCWARPQLRESSTTTTFRRGTRQRRRRRRRRQTRCSREKTVCSLRKRTARRRANKGKHRNNNHASGFRKRQWFQKWSPCTGELPHSRFRVRNMCRRCARVCMFSLFPRVISAYHATIARKRPRFRYCVNNFLEKNINNSQWRDHATVTMFAAIRLLRARARSIVSKVFRSLVFLIFSFSFFLVIWHEQVTRPFVFV